MPASAVRSRLHRSPEDSSSDPMSRSLIFKIPKGNVSNKVTDFVSDRSTTLPILEALAKGSISDKPAVNPKIVLALEGLKKHPSSLLNIPNTLPQLPFEVFTTQNYDRSIIDEPRLSVTKLLTDRWCELQHFYNVYSGLQTETNQRLEAGKVYHNSLEEAEHVKRDVGDAVDDLLERIEKLAESDYDLIRNHRLLYWSYDLVERVLVRMLYLTQHGVAREIYLHSFINLQDGSLIEDIEKLKDGVLVNGIADVVKLKGHGAGADKNCEQLVEEVGNISVKHTVYDFPELIKIGRARVLSLGKNLTLEVRDVKTRKQRSLPPLKLIVDSAKYQCMYYVKFLTNLARDPNFTFHSLLESCSRRRGEPFEPIGELNTAVLLIKHFEVLVKDALRLAKGEEIGFKPFDDKMKDTFRAGSITMGQPYSLKNAISEEEFREYLSRVYDDSNLVNMDIAPLFKEWKYPLTPCYFAARAAQVYTTLKDVTPSSVAIEYHHIKSNEIFSEKVFPYKEKEIGKHLRRTALFWDGRRKPDPVDNLNKCGNCEFNSRCPVTNAPKQETIGAAIYDELL